MRCEDHLHPATAIREVAALAHAMLAPCAWSRNEVLDWLNTEWPDAGPEVQASLPDGARLVSLASSDAMVNWNQQWAFGP
jgi:hypothetical protein